MEIREYQNEIKRTLNKDLDKKEQIINMALGLCGEAGEAADLIKKGYFQGHPIANEKVINELGDIAYYLVNLADFIGVDFREVLEFNIQKLYKRYPNGFSVAASLERVDTIE